MPKVLISYRRSDTAHVAGRIFDKLVARYGADNVFMDISNTPFGIDFREHIAEVFSEGDILVALIGREWTGGAADGSRRIDRPNDMVRIEIETALQRKIPLIPVLIDDAPMPQPSDLPPTMEALAYRNAAELDSFRDFHPHMDRLIEAIERLFKVKSPTKPQPATPTAVSAELESGSPETIRRELVPAPSEPSAQPALESARVDRVPPSMAVSPAAGEKPTRDFERSEADRRPATSPESSHPPPRSLAMATNHISRPISAPGPERIIERALRWAVLLVLALLAFRSLGSILSFTMSSVLLDAGLSSVLLAGYHLWQVPLWWIFAALFVAWEFFADKSLAMSEHTSVAGGEKNALRLIAWPYTAFVAIRNAALPGHAPFWPLLVVIVGMAITFILSQLWSDSTATATANVYARLVVISGAGLVWPIVLFAMIWKIGRSPLFRKR